MVNWNSLFPDIEVKDILKDFIVRFGIVLKQRKGVMYLKTIEEIISDRANAINWSAKLVNTHTRKIDFSSKFAKENNFIYNNSVNDKELGSGVLSIDNETLKPSDDFYSSIFESVDTELFNTDYKSAIMNVYDPASTGITDFKDSPPFTVLTLRNPGLDPDITFDAIPRDDYKVGYFIDSEQSKDSGFTYFLGEFYGNYTTALQKSKMVEKEYRLSVMDIYGYDPHKLIYDGEGYYMINRISNFLPDTITKVQLFKVG